MRRWILVSAGIDAAATDDHHGSQRVAGTFRRQRQSDLDSVINPVHLMIILAVVVVLFGPKRLPEMGQKIGQALRDFRSATSDIRSQIGVDDIADSVNDIKSSLSLKPTDSPGSAAIVGGEAPVAADSATANQTIDTAAATDGPIPATLAGGLFEAGPVAPAAPNVDQLASSGQGLKGTDGHEGGVERSAALNRGQASSQDGTTTD